MKKLSLFLCSAAILILINVTNLRADDTVNQTNSVSTPPPPVEQPEKRESNDLNDMVQKQQQTIQILSNISKILHDTALAIIRKIG